VSNPPYIRTNDLCDLEQEVLDYDPILALDGKEDGLYFYRNIINDLKSHLNKDGRVYFEVGYDQALEVASMLEKDFTNINIIKDYSGIDRIVTATVKE
jgi:release factor glutamine methyltransferase